MSSIIRVEMLVLRPWRVAFFPVRKSMRSIIRKSRRRLSPRKFLRVAYFYVQEFRDAVQKYDLIILRHVLEHTYRPVELIGSLGSRLTPDGVLYIEVPNLDSGCARLFQGKWKGYYVPRHVFHFTPDALHQVITTAGLEGKIEANEMPLMGNMLSILFHFNKSNRLVQLAGILLHPLQILIETLSSSSTCINVRARLPVKQTDISDSL
jgi:SAM-dependent methyltransferase